MDPRLLTRHALQSLKREPYEGYVPRLRASTTQHIPGTQAARVCRAYIWILRHAMAWCGYRRSVVLKYMPAFRAEFEKHKDVRDPHKIELLVKVAEDKIQRYRHYNLFARPCAPGGTAYMRYCPPVMSLVNYEPPWEMTAAERVHKGAHASDIVHTGDPR
eukprot:gnl/Spiro4/23213_TR11470_c0_g1_i1.p1 gnl/Spiro4/23213_TR11470_c0_g1~~gnl/Spiro4/23213_TR11470_c0_g1_i1.p1  ORF type:complete len:170 (-),score=25.35 gnl/Spiro4/23213_TR11470_c0_g1_i1:54-533(-)